MAQLWVEYDLRKSDPFDGFKPLDSGVENCGRVIAELPGKYANRSKKKWHVVVQGQKHGALSDVEIVELIHGVKLKRDSLAWRKRMSSWQLCDSITSLITLFQSKDSNPPIVERPSRRVKRIKRKHLVAASAASLLLVGSYVWRYHINVPPQNDLVAVLLRNERGKQAETLNRRFPQQS